MITDNRGRHDVTSNQHGQGCNTAVMLVWIMTMHCRRTSQSDIVQDGHIVAHDCSFSNDKASAMVQQDSLAYCGCWMYVHCQSLCAAILQQDTTDFSMICRRVAYTLDKPQVCLMKALYWFFMISVCFA